jgi:hypothetical protein
MDQTNHHYFPTVLTLLLKLILGYTNSNLYSKIWDVVMCIFINIISVSEVHAEDGGSTFIWNFVNFYKAHDITEFSIN